MKVLAAMSGGVDSAVAAARAVDAGWDVTGVHLALSRQPATLRTGSRGCCSIEDSHDARRSADVLGIPFYIWDFAERFTEEVEASRSPADLSQTLHRFVAFLETLFGQVNMRAILNGHPFDPKTEVRGQRPEVS